MENKVLNFTAVVLLISFLCPAVSTAIEPDPGEQNWPSEISFKLEKMEDKEIADIRKYDTEIQKCNTTIESSGNIIRKAREQGNTKAEQIARKAQNTALEAKKKNEELRSLASINKKKVESALEYVRKGGVDPEARLEQVEYENMNDRWMQSQRHLIEQRLKDPNPYAGEIYRSLRTNAPPALPDRKYDNLKPGDVLLFHSDDTQSERFFVDSCNTYGSISSLPQ